MNKNANILSLDPMYSCLHEQISKLYLGGKFAFLSSIAMNVYLKGYDKFLISKLINGSSYSDYDMKLVSSVKSHYRSRLLYNEKRDLNFDELSYMAKFCCVFGDFIKKNKIGLVLIHNDLRWHHAVAIEVCKRENIPYLVTEQGLFRPHTTVVDGRGVNAYSSIMYESDFEIPTPSAVTPLKNSKNHNSSISKFYFLMFLLVYKFEGIFNSKLKYQHNDFSLIKYGNRFISQFFNGAYNDKEKINNINFEKYVFVPLQLQDDTQLLIHSDIKSNQEFISLIESTISKIDNGISILFKKHPNDTNDYEVAINSKFVNGSIYELSDKSCLAITINSSAAIDIIKTDTPLLLFGDSIYNKKDVAIKVTTSDFEVIARDILIDKKYGCKVESRSEFISYLFNEYSLHGAGYTYCDEEIKRILVKYNCY